MKILLTGATGYIGKRLLIQLLKEGHHIVCAVRDQRRFSTSKYKDAKGTLEVVECDLSDKASLSVIPRELDVAYYLIHSMAEGGDFSKTEKQSAQNFREAIEDTTAVQVIYLTGIVNEEKLSRHLYSRKAVEEALQSSQYALTALRAGIIVGSGSASFEIIRDLAEKLPVMVAPVWIKTRCQPIAIRNVIEFLTGVKLKAFTYHQHFDIAGKEILTYKEMILQYARARKLKRSIITVPFFSPRLSSYWLYFITSTSYTLAKNLVESMKVDVVAQPNNLNWQLGIQLISYPNAIQLAFDKIEQNDVLSSWHDSFPDHFHKKNVWQYLEVPEKGCFRDKKQAAVTNEPETLDRIFGIGGSKGWYSSSMLWRLRGLMDKLFGGVGLSRGRRDIRILEPGDSVDFWRVLYANRVEKRLLLFAEMKMPGEAWLEFTIKNDILYQTATFRPSGLAGRLYWYAVYPFHFFIFNSMIHQLTGAEK
ncbi:SDR family oxidoreductase [Niabella yanshanensis]|uniref:SDR family oxidoreductase n=1 Tax=Niabella yanshanensis TaxID=577386 RepID=A0ABZ0W7M5_9BACT|nr:SDR family oxidoreductase [Niabella yanshanensis]WQD38487.1 SDR family oxidoreductase [Niabella yanshanensis]